MNISNLFKSKPQHENATEAVKWHLKKYGSINQRQCLDNYGSWRLSDIIYRLHKSHGMNFETSEHKVMTRFNIETTVTTYHYNQK